MQQLTVVSKLTGVSSDVQASEINLNAPSIIKLAVSRDEISKLARINQDLVITLHSGETIVLKNFYVTNDQGASQLVLQEDNGTLWWVQDTDGVFHFQPIDDLTPLMAGESSHEGGAVWPWLLGGAAVAGGVAIAASSGGGGGGSHNDDPGNGNPGGGNGGEDPGNGNPGGGDGGTDDGSDPGNDSPGEGGSDDGNDTTPPSAPEITGITDNTGSITGTVPASGVTDDATPTLSGRGTAGNIISVYDSNGVLLGKTEVASNGTWSFTPNTPLGEANII
ncbi:BapA prefix-like domain-containing protein [Escherichia fergusonii]|uniref:BapA/Bap/LapF family prefix-like domain-containing protein n=1 Tax=Escherichia fergusonii TaxID=564 RepID=UPI0035256743